MAGRKPEPPHLLSLISDVRSDNLRLCKNAAMVRDIAATFAATPKAPPFVGREFRYIRTPGAGPSRTVFRMRRGEAVIVKGNARRAVDCVLRLRPGRNFRVVRSDGHSVVERVR